MNALSKIEQITRLDLARAPKTLSLPEWLLRCASGLTVGSQQVMRPDGVMARRPIPTIPRSLALSPAQSRQVAARIRELKEAKLQIDTDMAAGKVMELLLSFPGQPLNEAGAQARARGYLAAIEDLPVWAVAEACRKWLRAEVGDDKNYSFAPSPPQLRAIAVKAVEAVDHQLAMLERLLAADAVDDEPEFSEEHRAAMKAKLSTIFGVS